MTSRYLLALCCLGLLAAAAQAAVVVTTTDGPVIGTVLSVPVSGSAPVSIAQYLGIPYAAPPIGPLRFAKPAPRARWTVARNATEYSASCPQAPFFLPIYTAPGDDCLSVNVWTPVIGPISPTAAKRPVMVWIYGGGFMSGSSSLYAYTGDRLAATGTGAVVVSLNYRVGIFGFGAFSDGTSNLGLWDQQAALRWVQNNAAAFGGDPTRVTLFGESAGAISISLHLIIPSSQSLFAQVAMESGTAMQGLAGTATSFYDLAQRRTMTTNLLAAANCTGPSALACARALPTQALLDAQAIIFAGVGAGSVAMSPVIDGELITGEPLAVLYAASLPGASSILRRPIMIGNVFDEGT
jgi:para-nitrobenzyl esterase